MCNKITNAIFIEYIESYMINKPITFCSFFSCRYPSLTRHSYQSLVKYSAPRTMPNSSETLLGNNKKCGQQLAPETLQFLQTHLSIFKIFNFNLIIIIIIIIIIIFFSLPFFSLYII